LGLPPRSKRGVMDEDVHSHIGFDKDTILNKESPTLGSHRMDLGHLFGILLWEIYFLPQ